MSKSVISLRRGASTLAMARRELDRIESMTGTRPSDWLMDVYDQVIDDYYGPDGFDFDAFEMYLGFLADSFLDFHFEHARDLVMDL